MSEEKKPAYVTRAELYPILGSVYLLIALAIVGEARHEETVLGLIGYNLLAGVAIAMSLTYSILGMRQRRQTPPKRILTDADAPVDRPRE